MVVTQEKDPETQKVLRDIIENISTLKGDIGNIRDRALLVSMALSAGIIKLDANGNIANANPPSDPAFSTDSVTSQSITVVDDRVQFDATGGKATGTYILDLTLPTNAIIQRAWYEVTTAFTGVGASVALGITTDDTNGILAPTAVGSLGVGFGDGIQDGAAANFSNETAAYRTIEAVVSGAALTAGVLDLYVRYYLTN